MTNAIGTGTANLAINIPVDERAALGRAAVAAGAKSVGEYLRGLWLAGAKAENPELAKEISQVRRQYYGAALMALFMCALVMGGSPERAMRRAPRRGRNETEYFQEEA